MSYTILAYDDSKIYNLSRFLVDTASDIKSLPTDCAPGSKAIVAENGSIFLLNNNHEWKKQTFNGGGSSDEDDNSYELLYSGEIAYSTDSTSVIDAFTIIIPEPNKIIEGKMLYIKIRDKAGPRGDYYLGTDSFVPNPLEFESSTISSTNMYYHYTIKVPPLISENSSSYGIFPKTLNRQTGELAFSARYSRMTTGTINGTYLIEVYLINWPFGINLEEKKGE